MLFLQSKVSKNQNSTFGAILSNVWVPNGIQFALKQIPGSSLARFLRIPFTSRVKTKTAPICIGAIFVLMGRIVDDVRTAIGLKQEQIYIPSLKI